LCKNENHDRLVVNMINSNRTGGSMKKYHVVLAMINLLSYGKIFTTQLTADVCRSDNNKIKMFFSLDCPYCVKVMFFLATYDLTNNFEFLDVYDAENKKLLLEASKASQIPYIIDPKTNIKMAESDDIIAYIAKEFSINMKNYEHDLAEFIKKAEALQAAENPVDGDMAVLHDKDKFLKNIATSTKPVFVMVSAPWCPPCKAFKPIFYEISEKFAHTCTCILVNGDLNKELSAELGVTHYPSFFFYNKGKLVTSDEIFATQKQNITEYKQNIIDFITKLQS